MNKTDSWTRAYGTLLAQGGALGGNGGRIETSGHGLDVEGAVVSAAAGAETGTGGLWLLDPTDSVITQAVADTWVNTLSGGTSVTNAVNGNITTSGPVTMNVSGRNITLTLKATGYIALVDPASYIGTTNTAAANANPFTLTSRGNTRLNVVINPGSAGGAGGFWLAKGSSISTAGGDITIGGGTNAASAAVGVNTASYEGNALFRGATINGTLDSVDNFSYSGKIVIKGQGAPSAVAARGVSIAGTVSGGIVTIEGGGKGSAAGIAVGEGALGAGTITGNRSITLTGTKGTGSAIDISGNSRIYAHGENFISSYGALTVNATGSLVSTGLFESTTSTTFNMAGNDLSLTNPNNFFGGNLLSPVSVNNAGAVTLVSKSTIQLGTITATGKIDISTVLGDIFLNKNVSTSDASSDAVIFNAGKSLAAGTVGSGNTSGSIYSSDITMGVGSGGRVLLYTGYADSSVTELVAPGSGRFRYNSDESVSNFSAPLGSSGVYVISREQPTLTIAANSVDKTYDGLAYMGNNGVQDQSKWGFKNGDPTSILHGTLAYGGTSQGAVEAGSYDITPSGYTNDLGYAIKFVPGTLTIKPVLQPPDPSMPTNSGGRQQFELTDDSLPTSAAPKPEEDDTAAVRSESMEALAHNTAGSS